MSIILPLIWFFLIFGLIVKEVRPWMYLLNLLVIITVTLLQLFRG